MQVAYFTGASGNQNADSKIPEEAHGLDWIGYGTKLGQILFGIGCGVITVAIRYFGSYPEGVSYAILVMNCCVVLLDKLGRPKKFGAPKKEVAAK